MKPSAEESVRSRVKAGLLYFICGGIFCAGALLLMHTGTTSFPYHGEPFPVELSAGLGGLVAFMGLLQLLIAWILKMRGH